MAQIERVADGETRAGFLGRDASPRSRPALADILLSGEFGLLVLIVVFFGLFWIFAEGFASPFNLFTLGRTIAINIVIGFSMMVVIVTGGLNLSVGATAVCAVMFGGWLMQGLGLPLAVGLPAILLMGALLGLVNGVAIVRSGVHSFIVTLATMSIFFGAMLILTRAEPFNDLPADFAGFAKLRAFKFASPMLLVSIVVGLALAYLYRLTDIGRQMLAAGASPKAAELSGVPVGRMIVWCHVLSGALAAVAGAMLAMRNSAAIPAMAGNLGQDWLLPAFLAPVLGGTLLSGGRVSVLGTFLAAVFATIVTGGLLLMQIGEFWVQFCLGALLLAAVLIEKTRVGIVARRRLRA
jgi:ribose transport system permease protein